MIIGGKHANILGEDEIMQYTKPLEKSDSLGVFLWADVALVGFTSCFAYSANTRIGQVKCRQEEGIKNLRSYSSPHSSLKTVG